MNSSPKIIVIYHRADFDGIFSREVAKWFLKDTAEYIGWDYGDPVPVIPVGAQLYMIDISVRELMAYPCLIWIDHHRTAIEEYPSLVDGLRIDGVAACRLAWQWFTNSDWDVLDKQAFVDRRVKEPLAVQLVGEYDIWDKRDPNADLFQSGLRSCTPQFERLLDNDVAYVQKLLIQGTYVAHASREGQAYLMREGAFDLEFEGLRFLAINAAVRNSAAFESMVRPEHDGCLAFVWVPKKNRWKISLRGVPHKAGFDLSVIAVKFGGGGHRQACGFECDVLPFALGAPADTRGEVDSLGYEKPADPRLARARDPREGDVFTHFDMTLTVTSCADGVVNYTISRKDKAGPGCMPIEEWSRVVKNTLGHGAEFTPVGGVAGSIPRGKEGV